MSCVTFFSKEQFYKIIRFLWGDLSREEYKKLQEKEKAIREGIALLKKTRIKPSEEINCRLEALNTAAIKKPVTLEELLKGRS
jgi:tRNA U34 5-carboxymethylaminomethyl modifying enzyme MnmG/GidA